MVVTPVTTLSETCLGVATTTGCTSLPPMSALCASLRAKAVIAEWVGIQCAMQALCRACGCRMRSLATGKVHTGNQLL